MQQTHSTAQRMRTYLKLNRGVRGGALLLLDKLSARDGDGDGLLSWKEFSDALTACGVQIQDVKTLFKFAAKNDQNLVHVSAFIEYIRGPFSQKKREAVAHLFRTVVNVSGDGLASIEDIARAFKPHKHVDARLGRRTPSRLLLDLEDDLAFFCPEGYYSLAKFEAFFAYYYCFEEDVDFDDLLRLLWLNDGEADLSMSATISGETTLSADAAGKTAFIERMRASLRARGVRGVNTLKQRLAKYSEKGLINLFWLKRALKEAALAVPDVLANQVFFEYDTSKRGFINAEQLLADLLTPLSAELRELLEAAFHSLDYSMQGAVDADYLFGQYDAAQHPDVLSGVKHAHAELEDLIASLDSGADEGQGRVSRREFITHYEWVASLGGEARTKAVLRGCWGVGESQVEAYRSRGGLGVGARPDVGAVEERAELALALEGGTAGPLLAPYKDALPAPESDMDGLDLKGGVRFTMARMRLEMRARGLRALLNANRAVRALDVEGDRTVSQSQFFQFMRETFPGTFTALELADLFDFLDDTEEQASAVMRALRAPLPDKSRKMLRLVFDRLDREGRGVVDAHCVAAGYVSARHPEVRAGRRSAEDEYRDFLDGFDVGGEVEGAVTRAEFLAYYTNVAASMDGEDAFCAMVGACWLHPTDLDDFLAEYAKNCPPAAPPAPLKIENFNSKEAYNIINLRKLVGAPSGSSPPLRQSTSIFEHPVALRDQGVDAGVPFLIKKAIAALKLRGKSSMLNFQRRLRAADTNGDKCVSCSQFLTFLRDTFGGLFTDSEMRALFDHLDVRGSTSVDNKRLVSIDAIMAAMRPPLGKRSERLLCAVFDRLDREGRGVVDAHCVAAGYVSARHPEVQAGRRSAEDEYRDFLDGFDVGGEVEGAVTRAEFLAYYTNVAASMDGEEALCRLVESTWLGADAVDSNVSAREAVAPAASRPRASPVLLPESAAACPTGRLRYQAGDRARENAELTNDFIFGRHSTDGMGRFIRNMHHHHSGAIFPTESDVDTVFEAVHDRSGKKHIELKKSDIFFSPPDM